MNNILIPSMGKSLFFKDSFFPKPMIEIEGKTMLEQVVENYFRLEDKHFVFVFDKKDCAEFHLDDSARILTGNDTDIVILGAQTAGALCTCLMAIQSINNNEPLIITNCDQTIDVDYNDVLKHFSENDVDAGVITFDSIHPRWSYGRKDGNYIVEVAEKRPISRNAIAGFYYYRKGSDFIKAAQNAIMKKNSTDGRYYISASMNEIILMGKKIGYYDIEKEQYKSFYSPAKIKEYEDSLR